MLQHCIGQLARSTVCALAALLLAGATSRAGTVDDTAGTEVDSTSQHNSARMDGPADSHDEMSGVGGMARGTTPAGVHGAVMVKKGQTMLMYTPSYMSMGGNYVGTDKVSTERVLETPNRFAPPPYLRIVPSSMDTQMQMFGAIYGISDTVNIMVMGGYLKKSMTMTTYNMMGQAIGTRTNYTDGFSDMSALSLIRLYQDHVNHIHLGLGLSLPTGSNTEEMTMLSPMGTLMTMRAMYGMQLGTGTVDFLPQLTYTAVHHEWSWGAAYRGRLPVGDNGQGYNWGNAHELTGWLGYIVVPGVTTTGRIAASHAGQIEGLDPEIHGAMQGTNPDFFGGERVELFGGLELSGQEFGLGHSRLAIEAGAPVYQNLNGPQIGRDWQLNAALGLTF